MCEMLLFSPFPALPAFVFCCFHQCCHGSPKIRLGLRKHLLLSTGGAHFLLPLWKPPASAGLRIRCFPQPLSGSRYQKQKQIKAIAGNAGEWCQPLFSDLSPWGLFHSCKLPQSTPARVLGCQWELSVYLKKNLLLHSQLPIYVQSWAVVPSDMTYLFIF